VNRILLCITIALVAIAPNAWGDEPAPTKEQLDNAKKAFTEGKALYDAGKFLEAVDKFKESYRLSRNALLLYNIGHTLDQAGQKDKALFYYRKFLADAPANAAQRKDVQKRVEVIEKENLEADLQGTTTPANNGATTPPVKPDEQVKPPVKVKPSGTYTANDFQHQLVDAAPPGKPLDLSAFVPEDSGFSVTLYFRGAGESKFYSKPMRWRYKELVARIPAKMMTGSSIQYYIEVKDQGGNVVTKSGKSTSPNLVNIEASAPPRFYPDLADETTESVADRKHDEREDPLGGKTDVVDDTTGPQQPEKPPTGLTEPGSSKFKTWKWVSTGTAGVLLAGALGMYIYAGTQASNLADDSKMCGMPPCRQFDKQFDAAWQSAGQTTSTMFYAFTIVGVGAAAVAGYFWYKELTHHKRADVNARAKTSSPESTWAITPAFGDGFTGAAAAGRF